MEISTRIRTVGAAIKSRAAMEECVGHICSLKIREIATKAEMDAELKAVRDRYEKELGRIAEELLGPMALAQAWAEENPQEFAGKKSIEMVHGTVGFRTGMPQLKTLAGWTWEKVKALLLNTSRGYTRTKVEVAKDEILAKAEQLGQSELRAMGLRVVQEETFFVDVKTTPAEQRESNAAL